MSGRRWSRSTAVCSTPVSPLSTSRSIASGARRVIGRHWLASYYPVIIDEEVIGVGVVVVDITDRKEAEYFRSAVMDTMVEGLYTVDGEGRLTFMNAAASRILGWTEEELRGKDMHAAIHFQNADGSPHAHEDCALLAVRVAGRPVRMAHDAFTRKDGTICPVAYSAAPLMDRDDGPRHRCRVSRHDCGAGRRRPGQARAGHACVGRSDQGRTRWRRIGAPLAADRSSGGWAAEPGTATADGRIGGRPHPARELSSRSREVWADR